MTPWTQLGFSTEPSKLLLTDMDNIVWIGSIYQTWNRIRSKKWGTRWKLNLHIASENFPGCHLVSCHVRTWSRNWLVVLSCSFWMYLLYLACGMCGTASLTLQQDWPERWIKACFQIASFSLRRLQAVVRGRLVNSRQIRAQLRSRPKRRGEHFFCKSKVHHTPPYSRVWFYLVTIPHLILFDPFSICSSLVHFDVWLPSLRAHQGAMHRRMLYIAVVLAPRTGIATCLQQRSAKDPSPTSRNPKWYRAPVKCIWAT